MIPKDLCAPLPWLEFEVLDLCHWARHLNKIGVMVKAYFWICLIWVMVSSWKKLFIPPHWGDEQQEQGHVRRKTLLSVEVIIAVARNRGTRYAEEVWQWR
jgi:hypothetical protein